LAEARLPLAARAQANIEFGFDGEDFGEAQWLGAETHLSVVYIRIDMNVPRSVSEKEIVEIRTRGEQYGSMKL
jgi:hypothetical protein